MSALSPSHLDHPFHGLWSLWDMINFKFSAAHHVLSDLTMLIRVSDRNMKHEYVAAASGDPNASDALIQSIEMVHAITDSCRAIFTDLNSPHINDARVRLRYWLERKPHQWSELNTRARALRDNIDTEMQQLYYYQYSKNGAQKVLAWRDDWKPTLAAFVDIEDDIFSAVDCYALQHHTASVFHCMRVLEHGLNALAGDVELVFNLQQWNTIIEQIEAKIAETRKSSPRGPDKNERMQFLSAAAKEFFHFKDGWRNYVSHNRGKYDEHQAAAVLEHTRSFMNHLATRLAEY